MTEFCEQVNPRVLSEIRNRKMDSPRVQESRVQESWTTAPEKRVLLWLAGRVPSRIGPDHLTAVGLFSQIGAGVCYALAAHNRYALLGVIGCLLLNWLGV
jgi:hypothetical protein